LEIRWALSAQQPRHAWRTAPSAPDAQQQQQQQQQELHGRQQLGRRQQGEQQHATLRLSEVYVRSLLGIYNDVSSRNAGLLTLPPLPTQLASQAQVGACGLGRFCVCGLADMVRCVWTCRVC